MKKIIYIVLSLIMLSGCNILHENQSAITEDGTLKPEKKLETYQAIIPNLKFYKAKLPDGAKSYRINIYKIDGDTNNKIENGSLYDNLENIENLLKNGFSFSLGQFDNSYIISGEKSVGFFNMDKEEIETKNKSASLLYFNTEFEKLELNTAYILMVNDFFNEEESSTNVNAKTLDNFKTKKGHNYILMTISFSDKEIQQK